MSGGIIIQRRAALLAAAQDPSIYGSMTDGDKMAVDAIATKAPDETTAQDIRHLAKLIHHTVEYNP